MRNANSGGRAIVIGAGLAGLRCAEILQTAGLRPVVLEASDGVGGRIRTDEVEGFRLDRGFQVYLTGYEEAGSVLNLPSLELGTFRAGALVRVNGGFRPFADPLRHPWSGVRTLVGGPLPVSDLARLGRRRLRASGSPPWERQDGDRTTAALLRRSGYSAEAVERFFRPFFGGVFLDPDLDTSAALFEFLLDAFSRGKAALPRGGMESIPRQLARRLRDPVRTERRVVAVEPGRVTLDTGEAMEADAVVVATSLPEARWLTGVDDGRETRDTHALYFAAGSAPVSDPVLVLNGNGSGPINHVCFPSRVAAGYAPPGRTLVSVTVLDPETPDGLEERVREQLTEWFGGEVAGWRHLRTYRIRDALPAQPPGSLRAPRSPRLAPGLYLAGDHRTHASIEGALVSGRHAAEAVLSDMGSTIQDP